MFQTGKVGHFDIQDPVEKHDKNTNTNLKEFVSLWT